LKKAALDLGVTSSTSMSQIVKIAAQAEHADVHGIWIGEDLRRGGDVFVQASVAMLNAPSKIVGIGVTSPLVRNVSTVARAGAALGEIGPARFRLGLGVGGLQDLAKLGLTVDRPIAVLRNAVQTLRKIWSGEALSVQGEHLDIQQFKASYQAQAEIPIYLGVRGPKLLRLAAGIADGVILSGPMIYLEKTIHTLRQAAAARESRDELKTVVWLPTLVSRRHIDQELARVVAATVISDTPAQVLEMAEIPYEAVERVQNTAQKRGYWAASKHVTERLLDDLTISGKPSQIIEVFCAIASLGVDELVFGPPYGNPPLRSVREVVEAWARL
jgi:5,10-methylenetetrahydromethanopterin reductase